MGWFFFGIDNYFLMVYLGIVLFLMLVLICVYIGVIMLVVVVLVLLFLYCIGCDGLNDFV